MGLFPLDSDTELMTMCEFLPMDKYIEIYVSNMPAITMEQPETNK